MGAVPIPLNWSAHHAKLVGFVYLVLAPLMITVIAVAGYLDHRTLTSRTVVLARQGAEAHNAICALRADLQQRIQGTIDFLRDHPHGFDGITAGTIRLGLVSQEQTISALSAIDCTKGAP